MFLDKEYLWFSEHCCQYLILVKLQGKAGSSRPEVFCKKGVLENFENQFFVFLWILQNLQEQFFFHRTPPVAASEKLKAEAVVRRCSVKKVFLEISLNSQENICVRASF